VTVDDVLNDRKPKTGPAKLLAAVVISAVESLGETRQMDRINARAIVDDLDAHARRTQNWLADTLDHPNCYPPPPIRYI